MIHKNLKTQTSAPMVSIITVVYNGERYIENTINSVLNQTYPNIQYIIIDGASTDKTLSIVNKYIKNIDVLISEKDEGLSDAMNKGVMYSKGDYIIHMHADDFFISSDRVQIMLDNLLKSNNNWVSGFYLYVDSNSKVIKKDKFNQFSKKAMLIRNVIRHQATIIPISVFKSLKFDCKYKYAMDYDFFLNVWDKLGDPLFIPEYITCFRLDGNNLSSNFIKSINSEFCVRVNYRIKNKQVYKLIYDFGMYFLRVLKIYFYHNFKSNDIK